MQELQYINLAGEAVTFGSRPPFVFCGVTGTGNANIERRTLRGSMQNGERTVSLLRQGRLLNVTFHLFTYGRDDLYRERGLLANVLSAEKGFRRDTGERARIIYRNNHGRWWTWAVPASLPQWDRRIQNIHPSLKVAFDCDSPYWFSMEESSGGFEAAAEEGFTLPFSFPIRFGSRSLELRLVNRGHSPAPVKMTVYGEGEKPTIINHTTGARLRFTSPLPQGAVLEINTDPEDLSVMLAEGGERRNAYGYLDAATPISGFSLAPGENLIAYEAGGAGARTSVFVTWRDRFEGV